MSPRWSWFATVLFVLLAVPAVAGWSPLADFDGTVADTFRDFGGAHPTFIATVRVLTDVAATVPFLAAGLLLTALLWVRRERRPAILTLATTAVVPILWSLMHLWLPDPRPRDAFVTVTSYGFPSGHTSNATAAAVLAVILLHDRVTRRGRAVLITGAVSFAVLIALTRVILLAHWPSQAVGGWLLGLAVVPLLAQVILPKTPARNASIPRQQPV